MASSKTNLATKQTRRGGATKAKRPAGRRPSTASSRRSSQPGESRLRSFALPMFLSFCILVCLGALGFLGYQTVTASNFFDVAKIEVRGTDRSSSSDIRRIVEMQTEKSGVWNADLPAIKEKLEKMQWVKSAAVSRILPNGIRIQVIEREPQAMVKMSEGNMLVDADGMVIAPAKAQEPEFPFAMTGWNTAKSEAALKENIERVKTYQKMRAEWKEFDLASRVLSVNLEDIREPRAFIEDSGTTVSIALGRERFGEYLKRGINAIVGKGGTFEAVNLVGQNMILAPRKNPQQ